MADIPMSRMDDEGVEQDDELTTTISKAEGLLGPAEKSPKKMKDKGLAGKVTKVTGLAAALLKQINAARGNPYGITVLIEDFEDQTAAIQAELHQALNGGDFTATAVTSLLAQISEIGSIARTL